MDLGLELRHGTVSRAQPLNMLGPPGALSLLKLPPTEPSSLTPLALLEAFSFPQGPHSYQQMDL